MATTDAQKLVPLDQHTLLHYEQEPKGYKVRPVCKCGWVGRYSGSRDQASGQFSSHTARVWAAQRSA